MSGGGYKLDAEPAQVPADCAKHIHIHFAAIATSRGDLPELERPTKQPSRFALESSRQTQDVVFHHEVTTGIGRQPVVM
jgi:hypothetical protein